MELMTTSIWFVWMLFIGITAGLIVLEVFLARAERWWPGLLPPLFTLLWALFMCLNVASVGDVVSMLGALLITFLILNIPTWVLLAIYFVCREKKRKKKMGDKMNLYDLTCKTEKLKIILIP